MHSSCLFGLYCSAFLLKLFQLSINRHGNFMLVTSVSNFFGMNNYCANWLQNGIKVREVEGSIVSILHVDQLVKVHWILWVEV